MAGPDKPRGKPQKCLTDGPGGPDRAATDAPPGAPATPGRPATEAERRHAPDRTGHNQAGKTKQNKMATTQDNTALTLSELNGMVRSTIESVLTEEYWVEAELSEARESRGHCYMELIEKDPRSNTPVARASAKCWRQTWALLGPYFERATGQRLHAGMKVMLRVYAQFHEAFGFSWIVTDIDPTYTLGDMTRKRMEIIRRLKEEGVFELNKELELPLFTQRIAVISSETAAGYGDFCSQLAENGHGYAFTTRLFAAVMQGEQVEQSVIAALNRINAEADSFDCVVIIRGGGATSDMSGFDTLALAENVANFPLPVITGIGHDRDESILDMISHTRVKTPTAAAALLVSRLEAVEARIDDCRERVVRTVTNRLSSESHRLAAASGRIPALFSVAKARHGARLGIISERLKAAAAGCVSSHRHHVSMLAQGLVPEAMRQVATARHNIEMLEQRAKALDPALLLRRGYSITLLGGRAVRDAAALKHGDEIETRLNNGTIKSIVK